MIPISRQGIYFDSADNDFDSGHFDSASGMIPIPVRNDSDSGRNDSDSGSGRIWCWANWFHCQCRMIRD